MDRTRVLKSRLQHPLQDKDSLNANELKRGKHATIIQSSHLLPLHPFFFDTNMPQYALISPLDPVANKRKKSVSLLLLVGQNEDESTAPGTVHRLMNAKLQLLHMK